MYLVHGHFSLIASVFQCATFRCFVDLVLTGACWIIINPPPRLYIFRTNSLGVTLASRKSPQILFSSVVFFSGNFRLIGPSGILYNLVFTSFFILKHSE